MISIAFPTYNIKLTMELYSKKWIEHFQLTNIVYNTPLAQFWNASHQILKKTFVLKKISIKNQSSRTSLIDTNHDQAFDLAKNQTRLLNSIKSQAAPKCHKLIRTTSSSYIIYDSFKGQSLSSFMNSCSPSSLDISTIMINMVRQLSNYHREGIALFLLTQSSIFISEDKSIMFTDWTLAIKKQDSFKKHQQLIKLANKIPNYLIATFESLFNIDLYALGIVFEEILKNHQQGFPPVILRQFKGVIIKMTSIKQNTCLTMPIIMKDLEHIKQSLLEVSCETPTFNRGHLISKENIKNQFLNPKLKRMKSENIEIIDTERYSPHKYEVTSRDTESLLKCPSKSTLKGTRGSLSTNLSNHLEFIGKIILKKRSLASFLIMLSIEMQGLSPQLSFLLLKNARSTLKMAVSSSTKLKYDHEKIYFSIIAIIAPEIKTIQILLTKIKKHLSQSQQIDEKDANYSSINYLVNQKYLNSKIKQTIKLNLTNRKDTKIMFSQASEIYFQLYMLSKSIEFGSYENFWEKYFNRNKDEQIQNFIKNQKKLGLRYFKNKLEMVLEKID